MNVQTAIQEANKRLKEKNIKSFQLDTEILMSKILKKDRKYYI